MKLPGHSFVSWSAPTGRKPVAHFSHASPLYPALQVHAAVAATQTPRALQTADGVPTGVPVAEAMAAAALAVGHALAEPKQSAWQPWLCIDLDKYNGHLAFRFH